MSWRELLLRILPGGCETSSCAACALANHSGAFIHLRPGLALSHSVESSDLYGACALANHSDTFIHLRPGLALSHSVESSDLYGTDCHAHITKHLGYTFKTAVCSPMALAFLFGHLRCRLAAPVADWARFLPGFARVGAAAKSISPCTAATNQTCAQLPLCAKLAHVQILLALNGRRAKHLRKYVAGSSPSITTQWHWNSNSMFVVLIFVFSVSKIWAFCKAAFKSFPPDNNICTISSASGLQTVACAAEFFSVA